MPWHSLCFPQHNELCQRVLDQDYQMDPFGFVRQKGSWPGKALFCFSSEDVRSYTDVWIYCPLDPVPLVPSAPIAGSSGVSPVLMRGDPLWTVQRFWGVSVPARFWESRIQEYICSTPQVPAALQLKLEALLVDTEGLVPIAQFFDPPSPDHISGLEDLRVHSLADS